MRLWEKVQQDGADDIVAPRAYLFTAVRNACLMAARAKHIETEGDETIQRLETDPQLAVTPDTMQRSAREARLWTAIDSLSARRREVLLMIKRDGMTYAETAAELNISIKTVEHELAEAMQRLRGQRKDILYCLTFFSFCQWGYSRHTASCKRMTNKKHKMKTFIRPLLLTLVPLPPPMPTASSASPSTRRPRHHTHEHAMGQPQRGPQLELCVLAQAVCQLQRHVHPKLFALQLFRQ